MTEIIKTTMRLVITTVYLRGRQGIQGERGEQGEPGGITAELQLLYDETKQFKADAETAANNAKTAKTAAQDAQSKAETAEAGAVTAQTAAGT
ncbi:MAG: hypothetical protein Q4F91_05420, partial [Sutterella sp.]|nr:hypothetical protein [Sutterella sp.]